MCDIQYVYCHTFYSYAMYRWVFPPILCRVLVLYSTIGIRYGFGDCGLWLGLLMVISGGLLLRSTFVSPVVPLSVL